MKKSFVKILLFAAFLLVLAACSKDNSSKTGGILSFDETEDAGKIVDEVNRGELKQIKQRFKDNEPRLDELQNALKEKNPEKVKELCDKLIDEINAGTDTGKEAINKLRIAQEKNINDDYREYLGLKIQSLERYIEAFEERRQTAILLRNGYDPKNAAKRDEVIAAFKEREDKFKSLIQDARQISEQANQLSRESLNRKS